MTSGTITSKWHRLKKEIITGCTVSVILFTFDMSMLVKAAEREWRDSLFKSGIRRQGF